MHRKKSVLELQTHREIGSSVSMPSIDYGKFRDISKAEMQVVAMQQHVNNNVAKNRVFQSLSTHGWMSIGHWRQFFIAKSINFLLLEFLFMKL